MRAHIDICDVCHHGAYVDQGRMDFVPNDSPDAQMRAAFPFVYRFTCAACVARPT